jgi:hypothetical protein
MQHHQSALPAGASGIEAGYDVNAHNMQAQTSAGGLTLQHAASFIQGRDAEPGIDGTNAFDGPIKPAHSRAMGQSPLPAVNQVLSTDAAAIDAMDVGPGEVSYVKPGYEMQCKAFMQQWRNTDLPAYADANSSCLFGRNCRG